MAQESNYVLILLAKVHVLPKTFRNREHMRQHLQVAAIHHPRQAVVLEVADNALDAVVAVSALLANILTVQENRNTIIAMGLIIILIVLCAMARLNAKCALEKV
jgi:hypothetical protein